MKLGRPRKYRTPEDMGKLVVYIPATLKQSVMELAAQRLISRSSLVGTILDEYFENIAKNKKSNVSDTSCV